MRTMITNLDDTLKDWWNSEGSRLRQLPGEDKEEHTLRILREYNETLRYNLALIIAYSPKEDKETCTD